MESLAPVGDDNCQAGKEVLAREHVDNLVYVFPVNGGAPDWCTKLTLTNFGAEESEKYRSTYSSVPGRFESSRKPLLVCFPILFIEKKSCLVRERLSRSVLTIFLC